MSPRTFAQVDASVWRDQRGKLDEDLARWGLPPVDAISPALERVRSRGTAFLSAGENPLRAVEMAYVQGLLAGAAWQLERRRD